MKTRAITLTIGLIGIFAAIVILLIQNRKSFGIVWDAFTEVRLLGLSPDIEAAARAFILEAEKEGIFLRIPPDGGMRTFDQQADLYNQGRLFQGDIVTDAMAGESYHNYGLAFDVVEIVKGAALWNNPRWDFIGQLGKKHGFQWGGDWQEKNDFPHFQKTFGYKTSQLLTMKKNSNSKYLKLT